MARLSVFVVCLVAVSLTCVSPTEAQEPNKIAGGAIAAPTTPKPDDHPSEAVTPDITHVIVKIIIQPPFIQHASESGKYEGIFIDVLQELTSRLNLTYSISPQEDNKYGFEESPGYYAGLIGSLQRNEAQLAVAPLTISSKRHVAAAFTYPVMSSGLRILYKVPSAQTAGDPSFTVLITPFSPGLWVLISLMFVAVSVLLYVIGRFSPYEDHAFVGKAATYEGLTLINSALYVFSSLTFQGYTAAPRSMSGRVLAAVWWMFTMLVIASYTASLAAIFLAMKPSVHKMPFASFDELSKQTQVAYGIVGGGSTEYYLRNSERDLQKRLWATINAHGEDLKATNLNDGVMRVSKSDGDFALIMEGPMAEHYASQPPCSLMVVGEPLSEHSYGFACNSTTLCHALNMKILELIEQDFIYRTKEKWMNNGCNSEDTSEYVFRGLPFFDTFGGEPEYYAARTVTLKRFGVAFLLLVVGFVLSGAILVGEIFYAKRQGTAVPQRMPNIAADDRIRIDQNEYRDEDA